MTDRNRRRTRRARLAMRRRRAAALTAAAQATTPVIAAAGLCVKADDTGRVLLHQRCLDDFTAPGKWEFPGGHVDPGEDPYDAACREFYEETGIKVPDGGALAAAEVAEQGAFILFTLVVPEEFDLVGGQQEEAGLGNVAWFDPAEVEGSDILRDECKSNNWQAIKEATMKPAEAAPVAEPVLAADAPVETTPSATSWDDPTTAVLIYVEDPTSVTDGIDPTAADPPLFVTIGALDSLDRPSVEAAVVASLALDDMEDDAEEASDDVPEEADTGAFVLVWGDPSDPANLTVFAEDTGADGTAEPKAPPAGRSLIDEQALAAYALGQPRAATFGATGGSVTDKPWDGSAGRYTDEQYQRAAAGCDPASKGTVKSRCFLPHHEPDGTVNRNGVHAAAQRIGTLSGRSPDAVATAKRHLHAHYTQDLDEDPPDSIMSAVTAAAPPPQDGEPVVAPAPEWEALIVTEGEPTDDGHVISPGALRWRDPPLTMCFNPIDSSNAHEDAPVGGAVTEIMRDGARIMARGVYAQGPAGEACKAMVADPGMPLAPSVKLGDETLQMTFGPAGDLLTVLDGMILNFTLVPVQAQASTWIRNLAPAMPLMPPDLEPALASACVCDEGRDSWRFTGALIACAAGNGAPVHPPEWWFDFPPELAADGPPKALQITTEGRVFGHLAGPGCHLAKPNQCLTVGATSRDFTLFHHGGDDPDGGIVTAEGTRLRVGALTLSGGHASLRASADEAMAHYDDPDRVGAFFRAGWDDRRGLPYVAGAVLPRVSEEELQVMRALGVSGDWRVKEDWRTIDGKRTLVGLALVPVPGWPVAWRQAVVASGVVEAEVVDTFGALGADMTEPLAEPEPVTASAWLLAAAAEGMAAEVLRPEWEAEAASYAEVLGV